VKAQARRRHAEAQRKHAQLQREQGIPRRVDLALPLLEEGAMSRGIKMSTLKAWMRI
jgi:hypothetical protein